VPFFVRQVRLIRVLVSCVCVGVAFAGQVRADGRVDRSTVVVPASKTSTIERLNPVVLLSQAIASIMGLEADYVTLTESSLRTASLVTRRAALALSGAQVNGMNLEFVAGREQATVSLLLAESQIRVRLAPDLLLRCEVSSRDEANVDPELQFDLGVQFKFK
jgi:hypothetical protein